MVRELTTGDLINNLLVSSGPVISSDVDIFKKSVAIRYDILKIYIDMNSENLMDAKCQNDVFEIFAFQGLHNPEF